MTGNITPFHARTPYQIYSLGKKSPADKPIHFELGLQWATYSQIILTKIFDEEPLHSRMGLADGSFKFQINRIEQLIRKHIPLTKEGLVELCRAIHPLKEEATLPEGWIEALTAILSSNLRTVAKIETPTHSPLDKFLRTFGALHQESLNKPFTLPS